MSEPAIKKLLELAQNTWDKYMKDAEDEILQPLEQRDWRSQWPQTLFDARGSGSIPRVCQYADSVSRGFLR